MDSSKRGTLNLNLHPLKKLTNVHMTGCQVSQAARQQHPEGTSREAEVGFGYRSEKLSPLALSVDLLHNCIPPILIL